MARTVQPSWTQTSLDDLVLGYSVLKLLKAFSPQKYVEIVKENRNRETENPSNIVMSCFPGFLGMRIGVGPGQGSGVRDPSAARRSDPRSERFMEIRDPSKGYKIAL